MKQTVNAKNIEDKYPLDQPLGDVPILTESERHRLLTEWNDTRVDYPQYLCLGKEVYSSSIASSIIEAPAQEGMGPKKSIPIPIQNNVGSSVIIEESNKTGPGK